MTPVEYKDIDLFYNKIKTECNSFPGDENTKALTPEEFSYLRGTEDDLIKLIKRNPSHLYVFYAKGRDNALRALDYLLTKFSIIKNEKISENPDGVYVIVYYENWELFSAIRTNSK